MSLKQAIFNADELEVLEESFLVRHRLEEQYRDLDQQRHAAVFAMWVFLATEVMFFGVLFVSAGVYRYLHSEAVERASAKLNWMIGGGNTIVLLVSSFMMVMAVHYAQHGAKRKLIVFLLFTAAFGACFLGLKGLEYYLDYCDNLVPFVKFDPSEWINQEHLDASQVPQVELFLLFYWIMTGFHALHMIIGISAVLVMAVLAHRGHFDSVYYTPVDVTALYWHFVDMVWIFLLPMLYLQGTHTL
ncbi:MAG TPA: cytochrome c oxidase subunit 3 [Pirellulales bacterium]|jgi:cytochrome c oxidase subunit 3|nr:cytochrome c oxidase subunit 3 [Pirellulales bacterium]